MGIIFVACLCIVYVFGTYIYKNHAHSVDILALMNVNFVTFSV